MREKIKKKEFFDKNRWNHFNVDVAFNDYLSVDVVFLVLL